MSDAKKLRLVKVIVQPTFVIDDGNTLLEMSSEPVVVTAKDWPMFSADGFTKTINAYERNSEHP